MNWIEIITQHILPPSVTAFLGWVVGRKRSGAETVSVELKNAREIIQMQADYIDRQEEVIKKQEARIKQLEDIVAKHEGQIQKLLYEK
ncbi:hypothetical protein QQ054_01105 [Oscillatoria amoena NRMC-F 0135]|nr:hypothetical protein [Oscillatoria amoena NRMC-F 0135]